MGAVKEGLLLVCAADDDVTRALRYDLADATVEATACRVGEGVLANADGVAYAEHESDLNRLPLAVVLYNSLVARQLCELL